MMNQKKLLRSAFVILAAIVAAAPAAAEASGFRLNLSLGYGGAGIARAAAPATPGVPAVLAATRSEGPGTISLSIDYLFSDILSAGVEQSKGFRLGPFSSGMTFTGIFGRWYFLGPAPSVADASNNPGGETTIFVKKFSPFVGPAVGLGTGTITRTGDLIPDVSGSGIYFGYKLGADYPLARSVGIRPEIVYNTSLTGTDQITEFSAQCGIYFFL